MLISSSLTAVLLDSAGLHITCHIDGWCACFMCLLLYVCDRLALQQRRTCPTGATTHPSQPCQMMSCRRLLQMMSALSSAVRYNISDAEVVQQVRCKSPVRFLLKCNAETGFGDKASVTDVLMQTALTQSIATLQEVERGPLSLLGFWGRLCATASCLPVTRTSGWQKSSCLQ